MERAINVYITKDLKMFGSSAHQADVTQILHKYSFLIT
ncbi:hypothetical protein DCAR_0312065 [Daucus carota subsp. sativus]|uniref:Uncharacterized protein n=1 Tax=Daucus carota subsp. sativus TaxID=79200 RepID=A0A169WA13_DAUCS|nr:hypothetical protein DCAR_0312065 [Daucus carota subsp. sativus]